MDEGFPRYFSNSITSRQAVSRELVRFIQSGMLLFLVVAIAFPFAPVSGEPSEEPSITQQGLTLFEVDRELSRLRIQEASVQKQIIDHELALERQQAMLDERRKSSGRVLRAYYTGGRDNIWLLVVRMRSLHELLVTMEYINAIFQHDFRIMKSYVSALAERKQLKRQLQDRQLELQQFIAGYEQQRSRLAVLQAELDRRLAALSAEQQREELRQIEQLTADWEQTGILLFENVFGALSEAMNQVATLVNRESGGLEFSGNRIQVRLSERNFNAFLREQNDLFRHFQFSFQEGGVSVTGEYEGKKATITGNYVLENEPAHALRFEIRSIHYNGYELPDTTRIALQQQFQLTFEPGKLYAGLRVADLVNEDGQMTVQFSLSGFPLAFGR